MLAAACGGKTGSAAKATLLISMGPLMVFGLINV